MQMFTRRRLRVVAVSVATFGAAATLAVGVAPQAQAAGKLHSTTTLTATPSTSGLFRNVHLVAGVRILTLPGLVVIPTGTVTFTSPDGLNGPLLGTAKITPCYLKTCTAYIDTTQLPIGVNTVTATWSGDNAGAPSSGSTTVTVNLTSYSNKSNVTCIKGSTSCDAGLITDGGGTWLDTQTEDSVGATGNHTISEQVGPGTLPCANPLGAGALATFTDTPVVSSFKMSYYTLTNLTFASRVRADFAAHPNYLGCYAQNAPFTDGQTGSPAVFNPSLGLYVAPLANCNSVPYGSVCFNESEDYDQYGNYAPGDVSIDISWGYGTASDPKFIT